MAESDSTGTLTATYTYAEGGLVSMTRGGQTYFYQMSAHGDVVSLTDSSGTVVNSYSYDPWGAPLSATETVPNPFRYASYYYDTPTGLYYLHHRYYDPELHRFLTPDLVFGSLSAPACLDPYLYVLDNPATMADPTGLKPSSGSVRWCWVDMENLPDLLGPLKDMAQEALEWYVAKAETAPAWLEPVYWIGGGACALMTPENAWATETVLTLGLSWRWLAGAAGSQTAKAGVCGDYGGMQAGNKLHHIFDKAGRDFGPLIDSYGSENAVADAIMDATLAYVRANKTSGYFEAEVVVGGTALGVRGMVVNSIVSIGTVFLR